MTTNNAFFRRATTPSDINEHMPTLSYFAQYCYHIVEFGVRDGNSTIAFLDGFGNENGGHLFSFDKEDHRIPDGDISPATTLLDWTFRKVDTDLLTSIPDCDLFFIDSDHNADQVRRDLRFAEYVSRWIILHDTTRFESEGFFWPAGAGGPGTGIMLAVNEFLEANRGTWKLLYRYAHNNGLAILERCDGS